MSRGLLYFASSALADLIAYNSRLGLSTAYTTIYKSAKFLGVEQGKLSVDRGCDPAVVGFSIFDNVQNMHRVRHKRIGREDVMNVGIAGIFVEAPPSVTVDALDLDDKRRRIKMNLRQHLTVQQLRSFIDWDHRERVRALQFCQTLTRLIPELASIKADIQHAFENDVSILPLPAHKSVIHPLAPNANKQTIPTELKAGLRDLSAQIGQTPEDYLRRLQLLGGDGMSYSQLLQLKAYLQFHDGEFQSMELVEPVLQVWHTKWTSLIRAFKTHWGKTSGKHTNPASLGHSAAKIGRKQPGNMKKVEFYSGSEIMNTVADARILDIWSYMMFLLHC